MMFERVTPADRRAWRQRAFRALGLIPGFSKPNGDWSLPTIEWSIDDRRACIRGTICQRRPVDDDWEPHGAFEAWRRELGLTNHWERHNPYYGQTEYGAAAEEWRPDLIGRRVTVLLTVAIDDPWTAKVTHTEGTWTSRSPCTAPLSQKHSSVAHSGLVLQRHLFVT